MIVLKRLDDALRDGDHIRAVIRNTGVGQDGKTSGILMPSRSAQESLIRSVYQKAGLDPRDTTYIEAHGTGTATGDQEEIAAIQSVFGAKEAEAPLHIGSIKPNIGHLESASGIAGLIKGILMLERGVIPPTVNLEGLKSNLSLDDTRLKVGCSALDHYRSKLTFARYQLRLSHLLGAPYAASLSTASAMEGQTLMPYLIRERIIVGHLPSRMAPL